MPFESYQVFRPRFLACVVVLATAAQMLVAPASSRAAIMCSQTVAPEVVLGFGAPPRQLDLGATFGCSGATDLSYALPSGVGIPGPFTSTFDGALMTLAYSSNMGGGAGTIAVLAREQRDPATPDRDPAEQSLTIPIKFGDARATCWKGLPWTDGNSENVFIACSLWASPWGLSPSDVRFDLAIVKGPEKGTLSGFQVHPPYTNIESGYRQASFVYTVGEALRDSGNLVEDYAEIVATPTVPAGAPATTYRVEFKVQTKAKAVKPAAPSVPLQSSVRLVGGAPALKMTALATRGVRMTLPLTQPEVAVSAEARISAAAARQLGLQVRSGIRWVVVGSGTSKAAPAGDRTVAIVLTRAAKVRLSQQNDRTDAGRMKHLPVSIAFTLSRDGAVSRLMKPLTFRR